MGDFDCIVIGAGISGISAGYGLNKDNALFAILERGNDFGGTWNNIRFSGIRSDSDMWSFQFPWYPWLQNERIGEGQQILTYLKDAANFAGLNERTFFNQHVLSASFSRKHNRWTLVTAEGKKWTAKLLWMCCGYYEAFNGFSPEFDGVDTFKGLVIHPQTWADDPSTYRDKNVVVIGSGATAVTMVPVLAKEAKSVTQLQVCRLPVCFPFFFLLHIEVSRILCTSSQKIKDETVSRFVGGGRAC